jgi:eukaryotic-like serine/threonine-protein kinase
MMDAVLDRPRRDRDGDDAAPKAEECLDDATLAAHLDASCDEVTRARIDRHLDRCPRCRELVAEFARAFLSDRDEIPPSTSGRRMLEPGTHLGRYVVLSAAGSGAMGVVYAALDTELDRKVALKLLRTERPPEAGSHAGPNATARLIEEARVMAKLAHPNVVAVHDVQLVDGLPFVTMELVEGPTLRTWCLEPNRRARDVVRVFREAGEGLAAAHALGIVHRDFKPDNVLMGVGDRPRITDFGLAGVAASIPADERARVGKVTDALDAPLLTRTGVLVGTPAYMAPEQLEGGLGDARSDQFAFAVSLFEGLTGTRPFAAAGARELLQRIREGKPDVSDAHVPLGVRPVLSRALSASPDARYPSMDALVAALGRDPYTRFARMSAVAGAAVVLAVGTAAAYARFGPHPAACGGEASSGERAWSESDGRGVEARFRETAPALADEAWPRVKASLDGYARNLREARVATCEATRVQGRQSERTMELRMQCLDRRQEELAAMTRVLTEADVATVRRATSAASAMTPVAACSDPAAALSATPVPEDPRARQQVAQIRLDLARAAALERAGKYREGLELARAITVNADGVGFGPTRAEARLRQGILEDLAGGSKVARQVLLDAVFEAEASRQDEVAAEAWVALVFVNGNQLELHTEAEQSEVRARAAIARLGGSSRLEARLRFNVGRWLVMRGRFAEGAAKLRESLALRETMLGKDHADVAEALSELSAAVREQGDTAEAIALGERALSVREAALGSKHPDVAITLSTLGVALARAGKHEAALTYFLRALTIAEESLGASHPEVAPILNNVGLAYARTGRGAEGIAPLERALAIDIAAWGADDSEVANVESNLGYVYRLMGRWADARTHIERSIAIREKAQGKEHPFVGRGLSSLGWVALGEGKPKEARADFERALGILQKANGREHPDVGTQLVGIGATLVATKEAAAALPFLERAMAIYASKPPSAEKIAEAKLTLAKALWDAGKDRDRARTLGLEAAREYASFGAFTARERQDADRWVARHPTP